MDFKEINEILYNGKKLHLSDEERKRIVDCHLFLAHFAKDKVIYGINTGFGPMAQYRVSDNELNELQYNIVRSHSTGAGTPLSPIEVKSAMIARYSTFVAGHSGIHIDVVEQLLNFINRDIYPYIPEHGSVGASGDLVQLSHIALCLIGEGKVFYKNQWLPTAEVLKTEGLKPLKLHLRDGLSVVNGTAVMTGIGMVNLANAWKLFHIAVLQSVMINEVFSSYDDFFSPVLNGMKNHEGQRVVAQMMTKMAQGTHMLLNRQKELYEQKHGEDYFGNAKKLQPYYSLRCVPQILGPIYDTLTNCEKVLVDELNSVDDNPVVDIETRNVYHGGNFHGDYVSFEMDKLKIAITKLTMLIERQMNYIFHDRINGILPPFVNLGKLGLNYGLQASQFTATSTTAECQTLSNPMYVHSIPNNNDNQDVVSMGTNSALIARRIINNSYQVLAINSMALAQAVDCLKIDAKLSPLSRQFYTEVRQIVPVFIKDTPKYEEIENIINYLKNKTINI